MINTCLTQHSEKHSNFHHFFTNRIEKNSFNLVLILLWSSNYVLYNVCKIQKLFLSLKSKFLHYKQKILKHAVFFVVCKKKSNK